MDSDVQPGKPNIEIREAGKGDCALLANLIRDSFKEVAERFDLTRENAPTHPYFCTEDWVESALDKGVRFFIMVINGSPCGCVGVEKGGDRKFFMERLAVLPECRGLGFGEALVQHALTVAKKAGARDLLIGVISGELKLLDWYRGLGFVEVGRKHFEHLPFQVVFMSHKLSASRKLADN